ncbi:MAG: hypothetical protein EBZ61_09050 [Micrococcales bacterium]|nr:hypothetical protein [Micrococcales bacterium]
MRWIKKELNEDGKQQWSVYIDEDGFGREEDLIGYESFDTREEAIESCKNITWEDYDCSDR